MGLLDWLQPIGDIITSGINASAVRKTNEQNYDLQQKEWTREDSSYQRKVEDLKRAGLNPALALGAGSPSSLAVKMQAPQFDSPDMTAPIRMNVARQQARIASNEADVSDFQKEYMKMYWGSRFGFARDDGAGDSLAQQDRNRLVAQQLENARKQGRLLDLDAEFQTQLGQPGSLVQVLRQAILGNGGGLLDLVNTLKPPKNGYRR